MPVIAVASPKGGVGKSTLSTNIAGYFASRGHSVVLGDADRQLSAHLWLKQRPQTARPIGVWEVNADWISTPPKQATHAVLDTPAGLGGWRLKDALNIADRIIVPLQPSLFDIFATGQYLDELAAQRKDGLARVAIVGMRVDPRTLVAEKLRNFVDSLGLPVLGYLRNTQNYVQLAAQGQSIFDVTGSRVARDLEQWQGICTWLDQVG